MSNGKKEGINWRYHMGLVHMVANKYKRRCTATVQYEDIVQVGTLGLLKAIEKYDANLGSFSSYAFRWIRDSIQQELDSHSRTIKVPRYKALQAQADGSPYTLNGSEITEMNSPSLTPDYDTELDVHLLYSKASKAMLQHLNSNQQQVMRLRYMRDKTQVEISLIMKITPDWVYQLERQAITILRKKLTDDKE